MCILGWLTILQEEAFLFIAPKSYFLFSECQKQDVLWRNCQMKVSNWYLIHCKHIYNFLCSMLILHQLLYVLFTLRGIFMHFSGTNLLARCHSASSYFLLFLCFRKFTQKIFSELDETKAKIPIYLTWRRSPKERRRGARRRPHHRVARATPWPRHQVV
jgi:hypothetical protein